MSTNKPRFMVSLDPETYQEVLEYQNQRQLSAKSKAAEELVRIGLDSLKEKGVLVTPKQKKPSPEATMLKRYKQLDSRGRAAVNSVLSTEWDYARNHGKQIPLRPMPQSNSPPEADWYDVENLTVAAGYGQYADPDLGRSQIQMVKPPPPGTSRIVKVCGDSMEPTLYDGEYLFIQDSPDIEPGQLGIFLYEGEMFVKEAGTTGLHPHNPDYPDIEPGDSRIVCQGIVLGKVTDDYLP